jgi:hypothetical protein
MDVDVIVGTHRARASSRVAGTALPCGESGANLVAREDEIVYSPGHALPAGLGHQLAYIPMCIIYIYIYICVYVYVHIYMCICTEMLLACKILSQLTHARTYSGFTHGFIGSLVRGH